MTPNFSQNVFSLLMDEIKKPTILKNKKL